ncbi:hypothetical protein ACP70R_033443 [Stipagrostis hirtigluma subsp. patula]
MAGGSSSKKKRRGRRRNPAAELTDDLLVDILSRVPYKSLCRFRCVSRRWHALISHPDHRRRLPQSLVGFFYSTFHADRLPKSARCFANASPGMAPAFVRPSLSFLPHHGCDRLALMDSCNGLLLCRCFEPDDSYEFNYVVVNPATERWVVVPGARFWSTKLQTVRLGFDPAVSSHFHVFEFELDWTGTGDGEYQEEDDDKDGHVLGVKIYSSKTRAWSHKNSGWSYEISIRQEFKSVFLDGTLYVVGIDPVIAAVDVEGKTWRIIDFPRSKDSPFYDVDLGFIDMSQGRLYFANTDDITGDELAIWVLEDPAGEEWTLKHTVSYMHLVGRKHVIFGFEEWSIVAIHPERNLIFFVFGQDKKLMSYDMDSGTVRDIRVLGGNSNDRYFPYVALFSEPLADGK